MGADQPGQQTLLAPRESRHIRVFQQIGAVPVIAAVGDVESDLVQPCGPSEPLIRKRIGKAPGLTGLLQKIQHRGFDSLRLSHVDVIAPLHRAHRAVACILIGEAPEHVVEQPFAHRAFGNLHLLDTQHIEDRRQNHGAAGKHRPTVFGDRRQPQLAHMAGLDDVFQGLIQP